MRYAARGMSVAGLVLVRISLLLFVETMRDSALAFEARGRGDQSSGAEVAMLFLVLFDVARLTLLAMFLRGVAACTGYRGAASSAKALSIVTPSATLGALLFLVLVRVIAEPSAAVGVVLLVLICAAWIVVLVMGLGLLARCIRNIDKSLRALAVS
jgi:hypothetical protein